MNAKSHKFRRTSCFLRNLSECLTCQTVKLNYGKVDLHQLPSLVFIYKKKKNPVFFFFPLHCLIKSTFLSKIWGYYNISALDLCGFPQCKFHLTVKYFLICRSLWAIILTHTSVIVVMLILNLWSCWYCHLYTASFFLWQSPGLILRLCKKSTSSGMTYCERCSRELFFLPKLSRDPSEIVQRSCSSVLLFNKTFCRIFRTVSYLVSPHLHMSKH